jgi:aldehyde:ferredoxin oxidoreductase
VGLGAKVLFSRQRAGVDPLGPENILGFVTGPLTGTPVPAGARYEVVGKSPLTGTWGNANSGGDFGPNLKFAGYDAIFFTGISEKSIYLFIEDGVAEIRDAGHLWGKDTFETEAMLKSELGEETRVACIGPAGEKLSLISAIITNRGHAAARSGLGAVMGSKKLKAVVVIGTAEVPLADKRRVRELRREQIDELSKNEPTNRLRKFGTPGGTTIGLYLGRFKVKNLSGVASKDFPDVAPISGESFLNLTERREGCYRCPISCHARMKAGIEYKYEAGAFRPELESINALGANCLNNDLESITMAADICGRYGLDTISAGGTIAFAIECYENGLISKKDTDGIELTWGNHQAIVAMTEKLAKREGFGAILADGVKIAAEKIGKGTDKYAMHIHGQETPTADPRGEPSTGLIYQTDATPGRHMRAIGPAKGGKTFPLEKGVYTGIGAVGAWVNNYGYMLDAAGTCMFINCALSPADISSMLAGVTGWKYSEEELIRVGERIACTCQAFNVREGLKPSDFKLPDRALGKPPLKEGPTANITIDMDTMVKEYFEVRDWDIGTGKPSKKKLQELGIEDVAKKLWP